MVRTSFEGTRPPALTTGLSQEALESLRPELLAAHRELMSRRGKDVGFYDLGEQPKVVKALNREVSRLRSLADDLIVLGIGGSSLGGQALIQALGHTIDRPVQAHFIDNVDPDSLGDLLDALNPERTAACVITKSGGTVETLAQLLIVRRWLASNLGQGESRARMTFVTDPEKGFLRDIAQKEGIRCFDVPPSVGGRYSVLTPVGLLPAAFLGIDIEGVLAGAKAMVDRVTGDSIEDNPACDLAAAAYLCAQQLGRSQVVFMPYADSLRIVSSWFVQLWAESLGKRNNRRGQEVHAGSTPIAALGATDQHSQLQLFIEGPADKMVWLIGVEKFRRKLELPPEWEGRDEVTFLHGKNLSDLLDAERRATRTALLDAGVPVVDITLPQVDAHHVGALFMLLEAACACTGLLMGVNPFDQPGVEQGKRMALGLMGREGYEEDAQRVLARGAT